MHGQIKDQGCLSQLCCREYDPPPRYIPHRKSYIYLGGSYSLVGTRFINVHFYRNSYRKMNVNQTRPLLLFSLFYIFHFPFLETKLFFIFGDATPRGVS